MNMGLQTPVDMRAEHGGPDALGVARWDFSTNANACGPCPQALAAVQQADARHYPDPTYADVCQRLATFHGVAAGRIVVAASASEFIARLTAAVVRTGGQSVWQPEVCYGDYGRAAAAWGLQRVGAPAQADLLWLCEPSSPLGGSERWSCDVAALSGVVVLDRAYEPLRLSGAFSLGAYALQRVWQLWSPNKALGLTGVRGAYAIAPALEPALLPVVRALAPSWPLGGHAVAMLQAWTRGDVQQWLARSREQLSAWKAAQLALLNQLGWTCLPSDANYVCARPPRAIDPAALRSHGIKLRETTSLGLPDHWRLSVSPLAAQADLGAALEMQMETFP